MKLKRENELKKNCETKSSKNYDEKEGERKKESEKHERKQKNKRVFMLRRVMSRVLFYTNQPIFVLLYKEACFNNNKLDK